MYQFSDFKITTEAKPFTGDKIKIDRLLNKPIAVHAYKTGDSNYKDKGSGKLLTLQIMVDGAQRVVFTGSTVLMEQIKKVPRNAFPFQTIIVKEDDSYKFT